LENYNVGKSPLKATLLLQAASPLGCGFAARVGVPLVCRSPPSSRGSAAIGCGFAANRSSRSDTALIIL